MQLVALFAAFWTAVLLYRGDRPRSFVLGLGAAAVFAHLGWAALHWDALQRAPWALLDPAGYCVLFAPLGVLLFARSAAAFRALPLAFAVARAGCLAAGCCRGPDGQPLPLFELAGLVALHAALSRLSDSCVIPGFCAGFGLVRLGVEPWRAVPPLGEPAIAAAWVAGAWVAAGVAIAARAPVSTIRSCWRGVPRFGTSQSS
jgi:hypothetical protein